MSEVRRDPLTDAWVIVAPNRDHRPDELVEAQLSGSTVIACPFCAGNEQLTPDPTLTILDDEDDPESWSVRVVPNRYPAVEACNGKVSEEAMLQSHAFEAFALTGGHEVFIESPLHVHSLTELSESRVIDVFSAYLNRMRYWRERPDVDYHILFKNVGAAAGASLRHTHSQLIATSVMPGSISALMSRLGEHHGSTGQCMVCSMSGEEQISGKRIIATTDHFVALCPFASRVPYLMRLIPRQHQDSFEAIEHTQLVDLAVLVRKLLKLVESILSPAAYNFIIHTRPTAFHDTAAFHWWMEIFPRVTKLAGFEWGSDCYINPVLPEAAATHLRSLSRQLERGSKKGSRSKRSNV
ncbi:Galactose-1-phosphate uridylyltransferase [Rosistilla oblonga]|uniref:Galactose-1-phosphate uridylyltransferase n=1 Tax=Rosistilla oblonga TaxID=2527990 RepID=A0A518IR47_9BACT|nr:DUF4921 family protein [Rosistilla oblonga]QDV11575.1 Galactose-1-phosphate uridylyltransferase [Rosistilla oblonga]QDV55566.1 Galactose-1-phosphate uridylyltransferase [Rosistilla oblonga]